MGHELWRPAEHFEGLYEVSDHGRVRSVERLVRYPDGHQQRIRERILKWQRGPGGYPRVSLSKGGRARPRFVHHLVLETFAGPRKPGEETLHADGDRWNPRLDNIRWGTRAENTSDAVRHGTRSRAHSRAAKLTHAAAAEIRALRGTVPQALLAERFGVDRSIISEVQAGKRWRGEMINA